MILRRRNIHQGYPFFNDQFGGFQCTAIAYVALTLLHSTLFTSVTDQIIDDIVYTGHATFVNISYSLSRIDSPRYLLHSEVDGYHIPGLVPLHFNLNQY